ncbi:DNA methyltransferase [Shewanella sp. GutCb]|uniref:DNA methyltransferase n=1 Tax=Shewanella sp. GutCb TaxID=2058315 RepID=UPI000C7DC594|nr:DNA methyltransferase [Shewanella sp. GutCb]PKG74820.1 DNA methyltransferase [Shewanella sp. GutCb]
MSSTHGNVRANELYPTPANVVDALMALLVLRPGDKFLEPCRGTDAIYNKVALPETQKSWAELDRGVNYLTTEFAQQDVIITNPPFSLTVDFLTKSLSELAPDGTLAYLQRVNFLGSKLRVPFWAEVGFPNKTPIIVPRPRFVGGGSDSCEYSWFIWDRGNRFPNMPHGLSHIISADPVKQPKAKKLNKAA